MHVFNPLPLLAAAALVAPGVALAQTQQSAQQAQAPKQMSKADFTKTLDQRFAAMDTNKDGSLDKAEVSAAQTKILQQAGTIQQQRIEAEFKKLDTNKDNQLSMAEFKAAAPPLRASETADQQLAELDTNKDGKISAQEYRAAPIASFDKTDTNRDGVITAAELQAARTKR
jgi:Ca2+-binding EF-hand superfamily protein